MTYQVTVDVSGEIDNREQRGLGGETHETQVNLAKNCPRIN